MKPDEINDSQKEQVRSWIAQGMKLAEIQSQISEQFGIRLTYMEVRFLVDDLGVQPKDEEPDKENEAKTQPETDGETTRDDSPELVPDDDPFGDGGMPGGSGNVSVTVDQIARPGALVSGNVTFSDSKKAEWRLDQLGRLSLIPETQGYKPSEEDMMAFQMELQRTLQKSGF